MMKRILEISVISFCVLAGVAFGYQIGDLRWDRSNLQTLRSFDKAAVVAFFNQWAGTEGKPGAVGTDQVIEFEWIDLAGDGREELVSTASFGPCCTYLSIYTQEAPGKIAFQSLKGGGKLSNTIRDLNGDGKQELIVRKELAEEGTWLPAADTPTWPAVYRLENGKYVEASRDFPNYYDEEILPNLDEGIRKAPNPDVSALQALEKNKILRVLGRDPVAGLQQAYQWMKSDDPQVLQCAIATFADIGGHEKELRTAQQALPAAEKHEMESRNGG